MASVCGILRFRKAGPGGLSAMLAALPGRGTDAARWLGGDVGFGCRALRPPEEARAESPLHFDREAGLAVAADARLDDRDALSDSLGVHRSERAALPDGDLILRAWRRWGRRCPNHLLGDYAFAVWDAGRRTLFCARDHAGVKPLYYSLTARSFVFASAVEAVLAAPDVSGALDEATVAESLTRVALSTTTRTFFQAVRKAPPGHALTVEGVSPASSSRMRVERYWRPEERAPRPRPVSDAACAEELLDLCARAVEDRLRGGPVGVHLSGGLDSSSVAVLAARGLRRRGRPPPPAFSWLPPLHGLPPGEAHAPEYARIDAVCAREGLRVLHCQGLGVEDVVSAMRRDGAYPHVTFHDETVHRRAEEQGVRVLLSGLGGDEGISSNGRRYHAHLLLGGRWWRLAAECRAHERPVRLLARTALRLVHPRLPRKVDRLWRPRPPPHYGEHWLIDPAFARRVKPPSVEPNRAVGVRRTQLWWLLRQGFLSGRMEGEAASGALYGIEYRYPLLDRRLLEFALGLPPEQFRRGRWGRWLMRSATAPLLPPDIRWNPSKADPARYEPERDAFARALPAIRRAILARGEAMARARYVDVPRLLERLDTDRYLAWDRPAPIMNALQLLDF